MADGPPDLRFSDTDKDCASCTGFKPNSQTCSMFHDWPVSPELVCNDWDPLDPGAVKDNESD